MKQLATEENKSVPLTWQPSLGAVVKPDGVLFRVWAPAARQVSVWTEKLPEQLMEKSPDGYFSLFLPGVSAGTRYRYRLDDKGLFPDPASRYQPGGVHGPSQIVEPAAFPWTDQDWKGIPPRQLVFYELHVGTFSASGTFSGVLEKLPYLVDLGITAIELMPVAEFPGERNWGYDGVDLFAPARCYGTPEELRSLVNAAHDAGLAVFQDVVYNHLGPDGNYLNQFSPHYFSETHHTPWGRGVNLDGEQAAEVRRFFIENACHWIAEYHMDGLRLDATHALIDDSPRHFLAELGEKVHGLRPEPAPMIIAEDCRNLDRIIRSPHEQGWDLDGVWSDDFHHQIRRRLVSDHEGYYADFDGSIPKLAQTIQQGWLYSGEYAPSFKGPRGTPPDGLPPQKFVFCIQNHDQVGNRAFGERLNHQINPAAFRAATGLLLSCPETPLLFMGQEWAASTPFLYFTDHAPELGKLVTEGRRGEFQVFSNFVDPAQRENIPDPQDENTFLRSRLNWNEANQATPQRLRSMVSMLLKWRRTEPGFAGAAVTTALNETTLVLARPGVVRDLLIVCNLSGESRVEIPCQESLILWSTEDAEYCVDPYPVGVHTINARTFIHFQRPGAVAIKCNHEPAN